LKKEIIAKIGLQTLTTRDFATPSADTQLKYESLLGSTKGSGPSKHEYNDWEGKGNIRQPGIPHNILKVGFRFSSSNSTHAFSNELLLKVFTTMSHVLQNINIVQCSVFARQQLVCVYYYV